MIDVGRRIRDYEIVAHLKQGGMARLFLARRVGPQGFARPVAIKVVHPHMVSDELVKMFIDEARLSASIQHPNVVHVEELGEVEGTFFLAMEYLHGESLSSLLAALMRVERTLPIEIAVWIASSAAAGLHAAHEACDGAGQPLGVVHRDVSPQNVLVSIDGHVKLIDFGVAKMRAAAVATEIGMLKGKIAYMSPEQADAGAIDRRTDVYALGIVLWEMLTMQRLFAGDNELQTLDAVLRKQVKPPSAFVAGIPAALDAVVMRALSRDPSTRFATAAEMQRELARAMPEAIGTGGPMLAQLVREVLGERIESRKREIGARESIPMPEPTRPATESDATVVTKTVGHEERTLAVMPFRVITASDASIGEWLADDLRDVLSRVRGLRVKARTTPVGSSEDASTYGERAGVRLVVSGRIHQDPKRVRLAVSLTSVDDGFQLWADRFDCSIEDVLDVSDKVARSIVEALGMLRMRGEARGTADPEAIQLYAQIRTVAKTASVSETFAADLVDRALAVAPRDPAILSVAAMYLARDAFRPNTPASHLARAKDLAERAIELAPELPEPWMAMGHVRYQLGEPTGTAVRALRRAVASGPSVADAHDLLGRILSEAGLLDEARHMLEHALWLDPNLTVTIGELVRLDSFAGDWDRVLERLAQLRTKSALRHAMIAARASLWARKPLAEVELDATATHATGLVRVAMVAAKTGAVPREELARVEGYPDQFPPGSRPRRFFLQISAELFGSIGERARTIEALVSAAAEGSDDIAWFEQCPVLREVKDDPGVMKAVQTVRERAAEVRRAWDEW